MVPGTTWVFPDDLRAAPGGDGSGGGGVSPSALGGAGGDGAPGAPGGLTGLAGGRGGAGGHAGAAASGLAGGAGGGGLVGLEEEAGDGQLDINEVSGDAPTHTQAPRTRVVAPGCAAEWVRRLPHAPPPLPPHAAPTLPRSHACAWTTRPLSVPTHPLQLGDALAELGGEGLSLHEEDA